MPKFVAFGHRKLVGKNTCAKFLKSHLRITRSKIDIQTYGFADKIKDIAYQIYGWAGLHPKDYYEENPKAKEIIIEKLNLTPRQIWIHIGMTIRQLYDATWLDYLLNHITSDIVIISDMRFPIEAEKIKEYGGLVIKVERPGIIHVPDEADDPLENYNGWSHKIINNGSFTDLNQKVLELAELI